MTLQEFGAYLTEKRQARSLSIQDIANSLKLSVRVVQAMEDINLDDLPHTAYVRAFYFSYAAKLNIDDELVCTALDELVVEPVDDPSSAYSPIKPSGRRLGTLLLLATLVVGLIAVIYAIMSSSIISDLSSMASRPKAQQSEQVFSGDLSLADNPLTVSSAPSTKSTAESLESKQASEIRKALAAVEVPVFPTGIQITDELGLKSKSAATQNANGLLAGDKKVVDAGADGQKKVQAITKVPVKPTTKTTQEISPRVETPAPPVAKPTRPVNSNYLQMDLGTRHTLVLTGLNDSWLRVTVGVTVRQFSIKKGQSLTVRFNDKASLRLGNAGGIAATFDGKKLPSLGVPGEVRTVTFPNL